MTNIERNLRAQKVVGIVTAIGAAAALILRIALAFEVSSVKSSYASTVIAGSKKMSKSEYLKLAGTESTILTIAVIGLVIISLGFLLSYNKKKKQSVN